MDRRHGRTSTHDKECGLILKVDPSNKLVGGDIQGQYRSLYKLALKLWKNCK